MAPVMSSVTVASEQDLDSRRLKDLDVTVLPRTSD